jgi:hypothetical protein
MGYHLLTEVIDSKFVDTYFGKNKGGNLYKEGWPGQQGTVLFHLLQPTLPSNQL